MGERLGWTFLSPSVLIPPPLACTWEDQHLAVELLGGVVEGIGIMIEGMIGTIIEGEVLHHTGEGAPPLTIGGEISEAGAEAFLQEGETTPPGDTEVGLDAGNE